MRDKRLNHEGTGKGGVSEGGGDYGYISGVSAPQKRMVVNGG